MKSKPADGSSLSVCLKIKWKLIIIIITNRSINNLLQKIHKQNQETKSRENIWNRCKKALNFLINIFKVNKEKVNHPVERQECKWGEKRSFERCLIHAV